MKPEMTNLRGKARLLKPAMRQWHQIATTENVVSRLTTFKKTHSISTEHPFFLHTPCRGDHSEKIPRFCMSSLKCKRQQVLIYAEEQRKMGVRQLCLGSAGRNEEDKQQKSRHFENEVQVRR